MKEVAGELTRRTDALLRGQVTSRRPTYDRNLLILRLSIIAPALDNYEIEVATYSQPVELYPGQLVNDILELAKTISSEGELISALKTQVSAPKMQKIIASLLSQSKTAGEEP
jgi:hypothetical protein